MKIEKIRKVMQLYREKFQSFGIQKKEYSHNVKLNSSHSSLAHCYHMLDKMEVFIEQGRIDKVFRWLGFIQGVLWSRQVYALAELQEHNRKDPE